MRFRTCRIELWPPRRLHFGHPLLVATGRFGHPKFIRFGNAVWRCVGLENEPPARSVTICREALTDDCAGRNTRHSEKGRTWVPRARSPRWGNRKGDRQPRYPNLIERRTWGPSPDGSCTRWRLHVQVIPRRLAIGIVEDRGALQNGGHFPLAPYVLIRAPVNRGRS